MLVLIRATVLEADAPKLFNVQCRLLFIVEESIKVQDSTKAEEEEMSDFNRRKKQMTHLCLYAIEDQEVAKWWSMYGVVAVAQ